MDNIKIIIMSFFHISFWLKSINIYYYILCSKVEDIILFLISSLWLTADLRLMTSVCYLLASWSRQYNNCTNLTLSFCYRGDGETVATCKSNDNKIEDIFSKYWHDSCLIPEILICLYLFIKHRCRLFKTRKIKI